MQRMHYKAFAILALFIVITSLNETNKLIGSFYYDKEENFYVQDEVNGSGNDDYDDNDDDALLEEKLMNNSALLQKDDDRDYDDDDDEDGNNYYQYYDSGHIQPNNATGEEGSINDDNLNYYRYNDGDENVTSVEGDDDITYDDQQLASKTKESIHETTNNPNNQHLIKTNPNSNATILSDIINITHIPNQQQIIIHFKDPLLSSRQCYNPIVRGRLSGPFLSIIPFQAQNIILNDSHPSMKTQTALTHYAKALIGTYNLPRSGMYYIEIIGILCNQQFDSIPNYDFKQTCLISPLEHRLTGLNESINVHVNKDFDDEKTNDNRESIIGYWKRNQSLSTSQEEKVDEIFSPLYTRYQPMDCRSDETKITPRCNDAMNTTRFDPYGEFEFSNKWKVRLKESTEPYTTTTTTASANVTSTICIIGWSHSRHLVDSLRAVVWYEYNKTKKIEIPWIKAKYPHDLHDIQFFYNMQKQYNDYSDNNCTHIVVGLGQWPGYDPMLMDEYEREMKDAIDVMMQAREEMGFKLILRSIHYNPMGDVYSHCPPKDWRYPPVIEGYNRIIEKLCKKNDITYMSTNDVVGPLWDSADDWCHLTSKVGMAEAFYLLGSILLNDQQRNGTK